MEIFLSILATLLCVPWPAMIMMSPMMIAAPGFATEKSSILFAMAFFIYPAFAFILLYAIGFLFYGMNPLWWAVAFLLAGSLIALLYKLPMQLYNLFQGISNYDYCIQNDCIYLNGEKIKNADVKTFIHYNNRGYYSKDKNHVYYSTKKIKDADAATFGPLTNDNTNSYWHDKQHAYFTWKRIAGADGASFKYAGHHYAYDNNHVFFQNHLLPNADRKTFKPLADFIGKDAHHVFVTSNQVNTILKPADFEVVWINQELFGRDQQQIYALRYTMPFPLLPFPGADPETFEVVGQYYAKDKKQVYYYSYHIQEIRIVEGANPETFTLYYDHIRNTDSSDGNHFYKTGLLQKK
jgi:hypothetical protein